MSKYLDSTGLTHLWGKILEQDADVRTTTDAALAGKGGHITYDDTNRMIKLWAKAGDENDPSATPLSSIPVGDFVKDGMLSDVEIVTAGSVDNPAIDYDGKGTGEDGSYIAGEKFIKFTWNADAGEEKVDYLKVDEIGKVYTAGSGIAIGDNNTITAATTGEIKVSKALGDYKAGDVISSGTDIMLVLKNIFEQTLGVKKTDPSVSLSFKSGNNAGSYEYGTPISATWAASFGKGSYSGVDWTMTSAESDSGVTATGYTWTNATGDGATGTVNIPILEDSTTIKVKVTYTDGKIPTNNKGVEQASYQIKAGSKEATKTYTRKNYWWVGANTNKYADTTWTSDMVRGLSIGKSANNNTQLTIQDHKTLSVTFPAGSKQMVIAVPKGTSFVARLGKQDTDPNITSDFVKHDVSVLCGGTTNVEYDLCVYEATSGTSSNMIVTIFLQ